MNEQFVLELKKLLNCFPESYINRNLEVILIPKTNTYFSLEGCLTRKDIISKVLMWCTRDIAKARPYKQQKRNTAFYVKNSMYLKEYLGTVVNVNVVYHYLGNGINEELTDKFIDSGFNMEILYSEIEEVV